jgi:hypothetical protein
MKTLLIALLLLFVTSLAFGQSNIGVTTTGSPSACGFGNGTDNGNANLLCGVQVNVPSTCVAESLSFFVTAPSGNLVLSIYDATGIGGTPGQLLAQTNAFAAVANWNSQALQKPLSLSAGTYWLCYDPSSNDLGFAVQSGGRGFVAGVPYSNAMPGIAPAGSIVGGGCVWSIYASVASVTQLPRGYYTLPNGSSVVIP